MRTVPCDVTSWRCYWTCAVKIASHRSCHSVLFHFRKGSGAGNSSGRRSRAASCTIYYRVGGSQAPLSCAIKTRNTPRKPQHGGLKSFGIAFLLTAIAKWKIRLPTTGLGQQCSTTVSSQSSLYRKVSVPITSLCRCTRRRMSENKS